MNKSMTVYTTVIFAILVICVPAFAQTTDELITIRNNLDHAMNAHDFDTLISYLTDDAVYDFVPSPVTMKGKVEIRAFFEDLRVSFPDFSTTEGRILASGNVVVVDHALIGTHDGVWQGIPPTGNPVNIPHLDIFEFEGDKIKHLTSYTDMATIMIQVGAAQAPDMPDFIPSIQLPDPEPTGLSPLEANAEAISRWNSHDMADYAKILHSDFEMFAGPIGTQMNRDQWVAMSELYFQIFTGAHIEIVRVIDMGGGWILTEEISSGIQDGPFFGVSPTGRKATVRAVLLGHYDSDGLLTNMSYYFDNMTIVAQITAEEWPIEGTWITVAPTPLGNIILKAVYFAQDAAKTKFTAQLEQINGYPLLAELYPDSENIKFAGGQLNRTGLNNYEATLVGYFTKKSALQTEEIVGIVIITGDLTVTGPDSAAGQGSAAYYLGSQDADSDGFPDEGEEPVTCLPWIYSKKRVTVMPGCVPTQ